MNSIETQLMKVWTSLDAAQRELLELYVVQELSCRQIARRQHRSVAAVRRTLSGIYVRLLQATSHE